MNLCNFWICALSHLYETSSHLRKSVLADSVIGLKCMNCPYWSIESVMRASCVSNEFFLIVTIIGTRRGRLR